VQSLTTLSFQPHLIPGFAASGYGRIRCLTEWIGVLRCFGLLDDRFGLSAGGTRLPERGYPLRNSREKEANRRNQHGQRGSVASWCTLMLMGMAGLYSAKPPRNPKITP
jgi:hypothetical protein